MTENKLDRLLELQKSLGNIHGHDFIDNELFDEYQSLKSEIQQAIDENQQLKEKLEKIFKKQPYVRCCKCDHPMQRLTKPFVTQVGYQYVINYRMCCIHDEYGNDTSLGSQIYEKVKDNPKCKCDGHIYVDVPIPDELKQILDSKPTKISGDVPFS